MTDAPRPQKRGRKIAMTDSELDAFLATERTCRVASVGSDGPHATPLWFGWHDGALWLYSLTRSQRWADLGKDPRIAVVIDAGHDYGELHGVEITGVVEIVGELPRAGQPNDLLAPVERQFAQKYFGMADMVHDGRHGWLRVTVDKVASWDFRKLPAG